MGSRCEVIDMSDYQLQDDKVVIRLSDNACIPTDPGNRDYVTYQEWLILGNTPDPASIQAIPSITKRQMLIWLYINLDKADKDVQAAIATIKDPTKSAIALITWLNPDGLFNRSDPIIIELAPIFGLKPEQMDQAFTDASKV